MPTTDSPPPPGAGLSRRGFLQFCTLATSLLALPAGGAALLAERLPRARRLPVVWPHRFTLEEADMPALVEYLKGARR